MDRIRRDTFCVEELEKSDSELCDYGIWGSGDLGIWGLGDLWICGFGYLWIWGFGDLRISGVRSLGICGFGDPHPPPTHKSKGLIRCAQHYVFKRHPIAT